MERFQDMHHQLRELFEVPEDRLHQLLEEGVVDFWGDMQSVGVWQVGEDGPYWLRVGYYGADECRGGYFFFPCSQDMVELIRGWMA